MIASIWAQTRDGVIGRDGRIPFHYQDDFRRFKRLTVGATIIMGRRTFESIGSRTLPERLNIVVTSKPLEIGSSVVTADSVDTAIDIATRAALGLRNLRSSDIWFIGGTRIYEAAMAHVDRIDVTYVPDLVPVEGSVLAPAIDRDVFAAGPEVRHDRDERLTLQTFTRRQRATD